MNPEYVSALGNHLWQSTLFAGLAGFLTLALRNNRARVRHGVWLAASCKFLIPLSVLIALGGHVRWRAETTQSNIAIVMDEVSQPFTAPAISARRVAPPRTASPLPEILLAGWAIGFLGISGAWWIRWRRLLATVRAGAPVQLAIPVPARSSPTALEPGVFGVFKPTLLLPAGIIDRLSATQLQAVITHELCHIRYWDNLTAAIQMFVETVFWFHPLVWWIGKRMVEERERACDEEVLRVGNEPRDYAEGILNICKLYVGSSLPCVSAVTGSDLKKRINSIVRGNIGHELSPQQLVLLATAAVIAVVSPIAMGVLGPSRLLAQHNEPAAPVAFEVASVKANHSVEEASGINPSPGMFRATNVSLELLIEVAYSVRRFQVAGGPTWINAEKYDVTAKTAGKVPIPQVLSMLQTLLENRFKLKVHRESKELPVYILTVAKGGLKMQASSCTPVDPLQPGADPKRCSQMNYGSHGLNRTINALGIGTGSLAATLSQRLGRTVVDRTGLTDLFDFHLEYLPDSVQDKNPGDDPSKQTTPADAQGAPIFSALQEQLGLKLETGKGPVEVVVIDHAERPSEN